MGYPIHVLKNGRCLANISNSIIVPASVRKARGLNERYMVRTT
jgi:hypothetical protein